MRAIRHTATADSDLQSILEWTLDAFGRPPMERYSQLIGQALLDLAEGEEDPADISHGGPAPARTEADFGNPMLTEKNSNFNLC